METSTLRALIGVLTFLIWGALTLMAWAFWTEHGVGHASATGAGFGAPVLADPVVTNDSVALGWTAAVAPGPGTVDYVVERRAAGSEAWSPACGTDADHHTVATSCSEIPGLGTWEWRVVAFFRTWTATSDPSDAVAVGGRDITPPTGEVVAPLDGVAVRGSVVVSSSSADGGSGVASALFQRSVSGSGVWVNVGSADTSSPYGVSWVTSGVADGVYDVRVVTTDRAGNVATSGVVTVRVDNTAPSVSLAVVDGSWSWLGGSRVWFRSNVAGGFRVEATVVDGGSGAAQVSFPVVSTTRWSHAAEVVNEPSGGPFVSSVFSWSAGASTPGSYTVTVSDGAGNTATSVLTFGADAVVPSGVVTAPAVNANVRGSVAVSSSSADAGSGVASAQFQVSGAGLGVWSDLAVDVVSPFGVAWDTTTFADGVYDLRVVTTDQVGNVFTSATVANVRIDNTTPTGTITNPVDGDFLRGAVSMTTDSADAASGVSSVQFQRSAAGAGTWTNQGSADTTAPYAVTWSTTGTSDGLYDLRAVTTDRAGNTFVSMITVRVDNTKPVGAVSAPTASSNVRGITTVSSSSADAGGVATVQFQWSPRGTATWSALGAPVTDAPYSIAWDTTEFADGLYDLRVVTTDLAGNVTTSSAVNSIRVDNTAPTGSITAPTTANVRGSVVVSSSSADGGSGVASALFQRSVSGSGVWVNVGSADTSSPYGVSWVTSGVADGVYDVRVVTTDRAGNVATSGVVTVRVDNTAPSVSLAVVDGSWSWLGGSRVWFRSNVAGGFRVEATVVDGGSGAAQVSFPVVSTTRWSHAAEVVNEPSGGPFVSSVFSWSAGASTPGSYTVTVSDGAGNTATSVLTFGADAVVPSGVVTAPAVNANVRGSVAVSSSSADAGSGVASAQFQVSGAGLGVWSDLAVDVVSPFGVAWDTTTFADGVYDLRVVTTDQVGNVFTSATVANVRIDNTTPTGTITAPLADSEVSGASVAVSAGVLDSGSGVASVQFEISPRGAGGWFALGAADTTAPYGVVWNTTAGFSDGDHDLRAVVTDRAGNVSTTPVLPVVVRNGGP